MNAKGSFYNNVTPKKRKEIIQKVRNLHPTKLPIIVEYEPTFPNELRNERYKYLVNNDFRVFEFVNIIRDQIELSSKQGLLVYVNDDTKNVLIQQGKMLSTVYDRYSNLDGFLYLSLDLEHIYG